MKTARFGPAGNGEQFTALGYKKTIEVPAYCNRIGVNAYEYQCGHGVRIGQAAAAAFGAAAKEAGIRLSLHAPYYISLSSVEAEKRENSVRYILESAEAAAAMGAERVVVHSGSCSKISRAEALELAKGTLSAALTALEEAGLSHVTLCPETMGKINQLGTLEEVLELCGIDERLLPCIDFGHLNARTFGGISDKTDYAAILDRVEDKLGHDRLSVFHSHFSKIEYTDKGGEKRHLTFADETYGPQFEPLLDLVVQRGLTPTFICESAGTQGEDAATMKAYYDERMGAK